MATNTNLSLVRTCSEVRGSEAEALARIAFSAGWSRARKDYPCAGACPAGITAGSLYFSARLASGPVRFCRPCADSPHVHVEPVPDPFDFGGAA